MNAAELSETLNVPEAILSLERFHTAPDGSVNWIAMRDRLGEDRWRSYIRLRQVERDAKRGK